jgi:hypothetical protein
MKHSFKPVPSTMKKGHFFARCSISGHFPLSQTGKTREFKTSESVDMFSEFNTGTHLSSSLFVSCARALLISQGAEIRSVDPSSTGPHMRFGINTKFGPAEVCPLDNWIIFCFDEPIGKSFPFGLECLSGKCNLYATGGDHSALLEDLHERLSLCMPPTAIDDLKARLPKVLPACVMQSASGFYVGSWCQTEAGVHPHSRYSDYYADPSKAEAWLVKSLANQSL